MDVKTGTQTWSNAVQRADFKSDGTQTMSATDKAKFFQEENIGETLNKVADANYVDDSKKMRTVGNNQLNKDAFMSLLLTQMKNQDPTNPLKSHEMAAQLAQFTQLEKLTNIDQSINSLRNDQKPSLNYQALNLIGKAVNTDNSKITRTETTQNHEIRFNLAASAQNVEVTIKDLNGTELRKLTFPNLKEGKNELNWNGQMEDGTAAPIGDYVADIQAVASNGKKIYVESKIAGTITGVNFTPKGPQLLVGKQVVNLSDVKSISDPMAPIANGPQLGGKPVDISALGGMVANGGQSQAKRGEVKPETKPDAAKRARLAKGDIGDAAMTQDFINNLSKQGAKAGGMNGDGKGDQE